MAALWLLTGGPLKFTNIPYKAAKWLCTDSSSPEPLCVHLHADTQAEAAKHWKKSRREHTQSSTHLIYNLLRKGFKKM